MQSIKEATSDMFTEVKACFSKIRLKWGKLVGVTTDGCPSLVGKNVGFFEAYARNQKQKLVFLHCITHQEVLCKSVLRISNVTDVLIKIVISSGQEH